MKTKLLFFLVLVPLILSSLSYADYTGLVLGTDIMFYLPATNTYVFWDQPLLVTSFEINASEIYFYGASFDDANFRDFGISVANANVSIDAITSQYVKLTLYAPAGTISQLDFYSPSMPLTVRVISGTSEKVIQDSDYFHDKASFMNAGAPSALYTDHLSVKVEHHSPVTVYIYFVRYNPPTQASSSGGGGGAVAPASGGSGLNVPVPEPVMPTNNPEALRAGLILIMLSIIGVGIYSKARRQRLGDLWMRRLEKRFRPVKWKRREKWWE